MENLKLYWSCTILHQKVSFFIKVWEGGLTISTLFLFIYLLLPWDNRWGGKQFFPERFLCIWKKRECTQAICCVDFCRGINRDFYLIQQNTVLRGQSPKRRCCWNIPTSLPDHYLTVLPHTYFGMCRGWFWLFLFCCRR